MSAVTARNANPLLQKYLSELAHHPLRTKALTTGFLCFLQEILGSRIAGSPPKVSRSASPIVRFFASVYVDSTAAKMAVYGFLISAPLSHCLVAALQRAFKGRTSPRDRILQILASNLLISPIQASVFLASTAIINGAKSTKEVIKSVKAGFLPVVRISWAVSPLSMTIAQRYIPVELWVPFFTVIQFMLGTYFNVRIKTMRKAAKKDKDQDRKDY